MAEQNKKEAALNDMASAVQTLYALFGPSNGHYALSLPKLRIPGATGGDVDFDKLTKQVAQVVSQISG